MRLLRLILERSEHNYSVIASEKVRLAKDLGWDYKRASSTRISSGPGKAYQILG